MRVLSSLFISFVVLAMVSIAGFFVVREALLFWGVATVRQSLETLRGISRNSGTYIQACQQKGATAEPNQPLLSELRLRFTSSTEYELEVICGQFRLDPISIASGTLPFLVTKVPGTSGIVWDSAASGVVLGLWGRQQAVVADSGLTIVGDPKKTDLGFGPQTSCQGFGYQCCSAETTTGTGDQFKEALDCPLSCFAQCQARPVVLSLTTSPPADLAERVVRVRAGEAVTFSAVVDPGHVGSATTTFDFGDGQQATSTAQTVSESHAYQCLQASCRYQFKAVIVDANKGVSAQTPLSMLVVEVSN